MIEVSYKSLYDNFRNRAEAEDFIKMFNGIHDYIVNSNGYHQGMRNTIAVDFSIICYKLGLNAWEDFFDKWIRADEDFLGWDDEDTGRRFSTVEGYLDLWDSQGIEYFMLDDHFWLGLSEKAEEVIKLVD